MARRVVEGLTDLCPVGVHRTCGILASGILFVCVLNRLFSRLPLTLLESRRSPLFLGGLCHIWEVGAKVS